MNDINTLKAEIAKAQAIVDTAKPLADKLAEMQAAAATLAKAQSSLAVLTNKLNEAETAQRIRAKSAARWTIEAIVVGQGYKGGPASRHIVKASRIVTGLYGPEPRTETQSLDSMSPDLMDAVLAKREMVPSYILALDADPVEALRKHARHVARGYMTA